MAETEYKTMRVPKDAWETANKSKQDGETWGEFLQRCSQNPPEIKKFVEAGASNPAELRNGSSLDYDDVKSACAKALRDELPDGAFR